MKGLFSLLLLLIAAPVSAQDLRWEAPVLESPTTIELGTGYSWTVLDPTKDYTVRLPAKRKSGSTAIVGGHNVTIVGGEITVPNGDPLRRALYIKDATGTVHIEGVLINVGKAEADGIAIAAPKAIVQIQNVRIEGVHGWYRTWHADVLQPWGGVAELRVDRLTAITRYQGIQFTALTAPIGAVHLSRINIAGSGSQVWGNGKNGGNGGFLLWFECGHRAATTLDQVYLKPRSVRGPRLAAYTSADKATKCPSAYAADRNQVTFPGLPVAGFATIGAPVGGDFVPAGSVGASYGQ